jgi:DnaJ-class molecular chaperone
VHEPIEACASCRGTGAARESKLPCLRCRGKGVVTAAR